jgi:hypothetical protein
MRTIGSCLTAAVLAGCASSLDDIPGRWQLHASSSSRGNCVLTFSGAPAIGHGTVAPEGFCPQIFSTIPRWRIDAGRVVISNGRGETLADLAVGDNHLDGRTVTGEEISLNR